MSLWPLKIIVKLGLSWVPGRHKLLRRLGIFKHGKMDQVAYAHKIFTLHAKEAFDMHLPEDFVALELGPGDSVLSALVAKAYGATKIYLADEGDYASRDLSLYKQAAEELRRDFHLNVPDLSDVKSFDDLLQRCDAQYITRGLAGLQEIPSQSVDFIWSHSVVEHIRLRDYAATMRELARIVKPQGRVSHNVDLKDHLDYALNNLRFPESLWEQDFMAHAGFYTNRLRYSESVNLMKAAGFEVLDSATGSWDHVPTDKRKLWGRFQDMSDDELKIRSYRVLMKAA